jgi:hypothetical protein
MFIGLEPRAIDASSDAASGAGVLVGLFFVVALAVCWVAIWRYGRRDRQWERSYGQRRYEPIDDAALARLAEGEPNSTPEDRSS